MSILTLRPFASIIASLAVAALTSNFAVEQTAARIRSLAAAHRGVMLLTRRTQDVECENNSR